MSRDSRRLFSTPEMLSRFDPSLLVGFARHNRQALTSVGYAVPDLTSAGGLDLVALAHALATAARQDTPQADDLADGLYLVSLFGRPKNRRLLKDEIAARSLEIPAADALSDADYALAVYLADPTLLEATVARVALKARRSFAYFAPADLATAATIARFTDAKKARLLELIRRGLNDGRERGLTIVPYTDCPEEDWFLIRRSRLPERITHHDEQGQEVNQRVWMRVYDAAIFDRRTGVLKINCRDSLEKLYRGAFGSVYTRDSSFFVEREVFNLSPLRSPALSTLSCDDVADLKHVALEKVSYAAYEDGILTKYTVEKNDWYAETHGNRPPVPPDFQMIESATFRVQAKWRKQPAKCKVCTGNVLVYSRDDESIAFETFLRLRGFMRNVPLLSSKAA